MLDRMMIWLGIPRKIRLRETVLGLTRTFPVQENSELTEKKMVIESIPNFSREPKYILPH
jgi:hypothetical protein